MPSKLLQMMTEKAHATAFLESTRRYLNLPNDPELGLSAFAELRREWQRLFRELLKHAEAGGAEDWFALGHGYSNGWGAERDRVAAEAWFRRAAEAGQHPAMVRLALILKHPDRTECWEEGVRWLQRASAEGDSSAMVHLGFAYREGQGVDEDAEQAALWMLKAYESGDLHASIHAGRIYSAWLNRPVEAAHWFHLAADAQQKESYINLAMLYDDRASELFDPEKAAHWYHETVQNNGSSGPRAMLALARCYRDGLGVPADKNESKTWIQRLIESTPDTNEFHREGLNLREEMEIGLL